MARKTHRTNIRVEVTAKAPWLSRFTEDTEISACREIAAQIKRHVDDIAIVDVVWDNAKVCEHCGSDWTEDSDTYNGGCCTKDDEAAPPEEERNAAVAEPLRGIVNAVSEGVAE